MNKMATKLLYTGFETCFAHSTYENNTNWVLGSDKKNREKHISNLLLASQFDKRGATLWFQIDWQARHAWQTRRGILGLYI